MIAYSVYSRRVTRMLLRFNPAIHLDLWSALRESRNIHQSTHISIDYY